MATRILLRSLLLSGTLATTVSRSYSTLSLSTSSLLRLRPLLVVAGNSLRSSSLAAGVREFSSRPASSSLNDSNPNWSNRPPKETILLDGCDFNHWLVVMEKPEGDPTRDEIIDSFINTLAKVVGSYDEARMKIYSVSTRHYYAFGALVPEEDSYKIKDLPGVRWVLPDSYLDVKNKDYGGEPFIDGKAVPYDPKYHEEWVRNNARAQERNKRNDRPRNFDRSRNYERRRENTQYSGPPSGGGGMGGPPNNMGGPPAGGAPPPNMGGMQQGGGMGGPPRNAGGAPPPNMGGMQQGGGMGGMQQGGGMGGMQQGGGGMGGPPSGQPNNWDGAPRNMGGMPNNAPNYQQQPRYGPNNGGMPYQSGPGPNPGGPSYQSGPGPNRGGSPYQSGPGPNSGGAPYQSGSGPNNYAGNVGGGGNPYSSSNIPGRDTDMPPLSNYQ